MKKPSLVVLLAGSLGALFWLGQLAGGSFSERALADAESSKSERRNAGPSLTLERGGVSGLAARRAGLSETAQALIAHYDHGSFGGRAFLDTLVALDSVVLDHLMHELMARELSPQMRMMADLVYRRWAEVDPRARLKVLGEPASKDWSMRYYLTIYSLEALTRTDPQEALAFAASVETEVRRSLYLESIFGVLVNRDPVTAAEAIMEYGLASIPDAAQIQVMAGLMRSWGSTDPQAAAAFVGELSPGRVRGRALAHLAAEWGKSDPVAAMRWLRGFEESDPLVVSNATAKLVENAIEHQPEFVREFINNAENGALAGQTLVKLAKQYTETDAKSALAWIESLEDYDAIYSAGQGIILGLPPGDAAGFKQVQASAPASSRNRLMNVFVDRWAKQDPEKAIEWAKALELRERRAATEGILDALIDSEGGSHHSEIASLVDSDPNLRRSFAPYFAESWAQVDGAAAFAWASGVEFQGARLKALKQVMSSLFRSNAAEARALLEGAGNLSPKERESLGGLLPSP